MNVWIDGPPLLEPEPSPGYCTPLPAADAAHAEAGS